MKIPFIETLKLSGDTLENLPSYQNHIGSIHAGILFSFAEYKSGMFLQKSFKELSKDALPLLRESSIKYKETAFGKVWAKVTVDKDDMERFTQTYQKRGRGIIEIKVDVVDKDQKLVAAANFKWFIAKEG